MYQAGAGATVTTIAGIVEAANQKKLAKEQAKQAAKLRGEAKGVGLEQLDPYTLAAMNMAQQRANTGLPDAYEDAMNEQTAQSLRAIQESSPDGAASAAAIAAVLRGSNQNLATQNAQAMLQNQQNLQGASLDVGQRYRNLELEQTRKAEAIMAQAAALDAASTSNKFGADQTATRATAAGASQFAGTATAPSEGYKQPTQTQAPTYGKTDTTASYDTGIGNSTPSGKASAGDTNGDLSPEAIAAIDAYYKKKGGGTNSNGFWK